LHPESRELHGEAVLQRFEQLRKAAGLEGAIEYQ